MKNGMQLESNQGCKQSNIHLGRLALVLVLSLLYPLPVVHAAGLANPVYKISIEYKAHDKKVPAEATVTMPDKTSGVLDSAPTKIIVPSGSTPRLVVEDANPVLFSYGIDEVAVQQNQTNKVLEDFISQLSGVVTPGVGVTKTLKVKSFRSENGEIQKEDKNIRSNICRIDLVNGVDVNKFFSETLPNFSNLVSTAPKRKSSKNNNLPQAIEMVSLHPTEEAHESLKNAIGEMNGLGAFLNDLKALDSIRNDPIKNIAVKYDRVTTGCPAAPGTEPGTEVSVPGFSALQQIKLKNGVDWDGLSLGELSINLLAYKFDQYSETFNLASDLAKESANIGQPYPLKPKADAPIVVDYAHDSTVTFSIAKNNKYAPLLTPATKDFQNELAGLGKKSVDMTIENEYAVSIAPGAAYSFVQNPQYAVTSKNGQLVISETSSDYNKLSPAIVINISRTKYEGQSMTPHLQVGVIPQSNNLGFLLGGGFHSGGNMSFAVGIVYQKATVLKAGLSVGQIVANTADLQTESKYKTGLYFSIGYDLVPKK